MAHRTGRVGRAPLESARLDAAHLESAHRESAHLDTAHPQSAHLDGARPESRGPQLTIPAASLHVPAPQDVGDLGAGCGPEWLDRSVRTDLPELVRLRRRVHAHPELGHQESATTALIMRTLEETGIKARLIPSGTGVIAEMGSGSKLVGLRADIDALPIAERTGLPFSSTLPDVSHACGHDVHLTVLLGAAMALARAGDLGGRVRLIFQPAEEVFPGGSHDVIAAGGLDGLSRLFALHCDPRLEAGLVGLKAGAITSTSDVVELRVSGPGGHTSRPHLTADLVFALGTVITGLPALLTRRLDPRAAAVLVWGAVRSGEAANAIPQSGELRGTLRMMDRNSWDTAEPLVRELVAELLAPTECDFELTYHRGVPPVNNELFSTELMTAAAQRALGEDAIRLAEQSTGAEDFAVFLEQVPGSLARLGVWDGVSQRVDLHSSSFRVDERAIAAGVRLLAHTAVAALQH
ncbi:amidohydrolase [Nakamurella sp. GG22]